MPGRGKLTYHTEGEDPEPPPDRLARIADAARAAAEAHPEHRDGDQLIVVVTGSSPGFEEGSGLFAGGYTGLDAIVDTLVQNLEAIFEAQTGRPSAIILKRLADLYKPSPS